MKGRKIFFIVGILLAGVSSYLAYHYLNSHTETKTVLVLNENVEANQPISPDMLVEKELPIAAVPTDAIVNSKLVIGKSIRGMVLKDTIIRMEMLINTEQSRMSGMLLSKGSNFTAIALPIGIETTVGGTIQTGDYVDVYALNDKTGAEKILNDIEVLKGTPLNTEKTSSMNRHDFAVVLAVPNKAVQGFEQALANGSTIHLVLLPLNKE